MSAMWYKASNDLEIASNAISEGEILTEVDQASIGCAVSLLQKALSGARATRNKNLMSNRNYRVLAGMFQCVFQYRTRLHANSTESVLESMLDRLTPLTEHSGIILTDKDSQWISSVLGFVAKACEEEHLTSHELMKT